MDNTTKLSNLIDPEVMAPMITAKMESAIIVTPFAKIDTSLQGRAGDTITVPSYEYIGDAEDVAEGIEQGTAQLTTSTVQYTVKKAVKDVEITDEAMLSGYGNPVGEANTQLGKSLAQKVDTDAITVLQAGQVKKVNTGAISYDGIVDSIDLFDEEVEQEKAMFISPKQKTTLRKDPEFKSKETYGNDVVMTGEIGMIAGVRIVPSKKVVAAGGKYLNPIMKLNPATMTDDDTPALTIYLKRDTQVETDRIVKGKKTLISADRHYVAALTDNTKVVVAEFDEEI